MSPDEAGKGILLNNDLLVPCMSLICCVRKWDVCINHFCRVPKHAVVLKFQLN